MDTQDNLSKEQIEYAVTFLIQLAESRGLNGTQLHQLSGVSQPTVSSNLACAAAIARCIGEALPGSRGSTRRHHPLRGGGFQVLAYLPSNTTDGGCSRSGYGCGTASHRAENQRGGFDIRQSCFRAVLAWRPHTSRKEPRILSTPGLSNGSIPRVNV
jgi:hypothetical protein